MYEPFGLWTADGEPGLSAEKQRLRGARRSGQIVGTDYQEFTRDEGSADTARLLSRALIYRRASWYRGRMGTLARDALRLDVGITIESRPDFWTQPAEGAGAIYGVGLIEHDERVQPVLLADQAAVGRGDRILMPPFPAEEEPVLREALASLSEVLVGEIPPDLLALAIPEPVPYFRPGVRVNGPGTLGSFGALVSDVDGKDRVLTAGHVAPAGSQVTDDMGGIGLVTWSHNPAATAGPAPAADVAVVLPPTSSNVGGVAISSSGAASPGGDLSVHGANTPLGTTKTMGFTESMYVPAMAGMWAEVYFTTTAASQPGDSGCPVLLSGTDQIIGHVVGGAPGITSFIQSIEIQLKLAGCTIRRSP